MSVPLHVLILEDNPSDARLVVNALRQADYDVRWERVDSEAEYLNRLSSPYDIILSGFSMPQFNAIRALELMQQRGLDIPFIIISGSIGEDIAVAALKQGAADYLLKDRLGRLSDAVTQALERKRANEALHRSELQFRTLVERLPAAMYTCDPEGRITYCNEQAIQLWGRTPVLNDSRELFSGAYKLLTPMGETVAHDKSWMAKALCTGQAYNGQEIVTERPDGSRRTVLVNANPIREDSGKLLGAVNVLVDITERRKAEENQRQLAAERDSLLHRLQLQIERLPLAYILFDADFCITDWNAAAQSTLGYTREEALGLKPNDLIPSSFHPDAGKIMERIRAGDMAAHSVNENVTKDGRTITCEWFNTPLMKDDGLFGGLLCLGRDITDRKQLEEQIRRTENRLRHVVSSSPAVLYTLAFSGEQLYPTWISDNVWAMMGYTAEEVYQQYWWQERIHPDDAERTWTEIQQKLFTNDYLAQEYRFRHKDGSYYWVRSEMRLLRDESGRPWEVVGSWANITERKLLEEQYRHAQKMEAVGKLAGGVAHDFNNLLTVIMGYSEIYLSKLRPEDPLCVPLTEIYKAGERATGLTRQLLAFSRKQVLLPLVLDLNTILVEIERMLHRLIGEDVALTLLLEPHLWQVKADPGQMEQVVMNIVVNARDAMPEGGKVLIETKNVELDASYAQTHAETTIGEFVMLAVSDTGCGMDAIVKERIFEPFFTTKGPTKGTGLGLATVFGIVKQSGGHIEVYSELGQGTIFKIYLPRDKSGAPVSSSSRSKVPVRGGTETILLVEDEDGLRNLAMTVLQEQGYTVLDARHGGDALIICETHAMPIDVMITDVVMPHFSGRQLAERLAHRQPAMKVIFMSGYTDDAIVHHGVLESGMPFLQKPFAPEALARKVREVLDGPHPLPHERGQE